MLVYKEMIRFLPLLIFILPDVPTTLNNSQSTEKISEVHNIKVVS